ncbi:metallophosphoesterase family protein [Bacillus tuaregi]|uniref:metallophosphoesterase family protein n=1 Tax=Bacillus tuaregi TaxID=1816695 RepID=UPI0008F8ED35|nr:metallophosphoesterase [Bacillus tuaregi]
MKVLIVSDSHGMTAELEKLKEIHGHEVRYFIHCGDSELSPDHPAISEFVTVRGNCDFYNEYPEDITKEIGNRKFFITHGHRYSVKSDLMKLSYRAKELEADIACFGHSHYLGAEMVNGTLYLNPGSIRLPRGRRERTYVIVEILENAFELNVYDLDNGEITELRQVFPLS